MPPGIHAFCGLLPHVSALQRDLERPAGRYPFTAALLGLAAGLLERGFTASPLPALVLHVLHELLPQHHQVGAVAPARQAGIWMQQGKFSTKRCLEKRG